MADPVELVAEQIEVLPNGVVINPLFDWSPFLGIPLWVFITIGFVFLIALVVVYWALRLGRLSSVKGYVESLKKLTQDDVQVWIISRVKKLTIECMTIRDNVLSSHDTSNLGMYHVNTDQGVIRIGGTSAVVVSEDFDQNRDFITEIALTYNCDLFNNDLEKLKIEMEDKYKREVDLATANGLDLSTVVKQPIIKPINDCESYDKYGRKLLKSIYPNGLIYPSYSIFDPSKFRKYIPRGCSSMFYGGELLRDARKLNVKRREKGFLEVHAFLIMAFGISIIGIMAAWLFPIGSKVV